METLTETAGQNSVRTTHWGIIGGIAASLILMIGGAVAWYAFSNKDSVAQLETTAVATTTIITSREYAYLYRTPAVCNQTGDRCLFFYNPFGMLSNPDPKSLGTSTEVTLKNFSKLSTVCHGEMNTTEIGKALLKQSDINTSDQMTSDTLDALCGVMVRTTALVIAKPMMVDNRDIIAQFAVKDLEGLESILPWEAEVGLGDIYFDGNDIVWRISGYSTTEYRLKWITAQNSYDAQNITTKNIPGPSMYDY